MIQRWPCWCQPHVKFTLLDLHETKIIYLCVCTLVPFSIALCKSFPSLRRAWEEWFAVERHWDGISAECWWRRPAGLPAHTHRWTVCQGNLTHTDQRLPSRLTVGGNGTEREEEEQGKELITALMLHFIIVSWARLLTLSTSAWLSTQRPLLLGWSMSIINCTIGLHFCETDENFILQETL